MFFSSYFRAWADPLDPNTIVDFPQVVASKRPYAECVDYYNFDFDLLDLHTCWQRAVQQSKDSCYITARKSKRYVQNSSKLQKLDPRQLGWDKDCSDCFYGPFYPNTASKDCQSVQYKAGSSPCSQKSSLKKVFYGHTATKNNLRRSWSSSLLVDQERSPLALHAEISLSNRPNKEAFGSSIELNLTTPKKHIKFDNVPQYRIIARVEHCAQGDTRACQPYQRGPLIGNNEDSKDSTGENEIVEVPSTSNGDEEDDENNSTPFDWIPKYVPNVYLGPIVVEPEIIAELISPPTVYCISVCRQDPWFSEMINHPDFPLDFKAEDDDDEELLDVESGVEEIPISLSEGFAFGLILNKVLDWAIW